MKNVLVFGLGGARSAIELRWVREVVTLGAITRVPRAPAVVAGVTSVHGMVVPVLSGCDALVAAGLPAPPSPHPPRAGDPAVLLEVEATFVALPIDHIDAVTTLDASPDHPALLVDSDGRELAVLDTEAVVTAARRLVAEAEATRPRGAA
jgi:chemotaxis signal transduction protein